MGRPGKKITRKTILLTNRMKELELKERSSKSLLANVLDIEDDFRHAGGGITGSTTQISTSGLAKLKKKKIYRCYNMPHFLPIDSLDQQR